MHGSKVIMGTADKRTAEVGAERAIGVEVVDTTSRRRRNDLLCSRRLKCLNLAASRCLRSAAAFLDKAIADRTTTTTQQSCRE